jgi:hypothetical protein
MKTVHFSFNYEQFLGVHHSSKYKSLLFVLTDIQLSDNYYYYRYSALGPVWAETRAQSGDWYSSGTPHARQVHRGRLPLHSPAL